MTPAFRFSRQRHQTDDRLQKILNAFNSNSCTFTFTLHSYMYVYLYIFTICIFWKMKMDKNGYVYVGSVYHRAIAISPLRELECRQQTTRAKASEIHFTPFAPDPLRAFFTGPAVCLYLFLFIQLFDKGSFVLYGFNERKGTGRRGQMDFHLVKMVSRNCFYPSFFRFRAPGRINWTYVWRDFR